MKPKQKSAFISIALVTLAMLGLGACDSMKKVEWPHVYGPNEVPASVTSAPRPIESAPPPPDNIPYPRLGDVPARPTNFSSPEMIEETKARMAKDRDEAEALKDQTQTQ